MNQVNQRDEAIQGQDLPFCSDLGIPGTEYPTSGRPGPSPCEGWYARNQPAKPTPD
jgi:hypothetical protein